MQFLYLLKHLKIIAARKTIAIELAQYLDLLRREFSFGVARRDEVVTNGEFMVNHRSEAALDAKVIESGIALGLRLRAETSTCGPDQARSTS